jgi:hypothetical protein
VTRPDPAPFREAAQKVYDRFLTSEIDQHLLAVVRGAAD